MRLKFKKKFSNYTFVGRKYKDEFRKQMRLIIIFTLGFTIAFAWRETIFEWAQSLAISWVHSNSAQSSLWASVFITIFSIILLFLASLWLKDRNPYR